MKAVLNYFLSLYELTEQANMEREQLEYPTDTDNTEGSVATESSESTSDIYSTTSSSSTAVRQAAPSIQVLTRRAPVAPAVVVAVRRLTKPPASHPDLLE